MNLCSFQKCSWTGVSVKITAFNRVAALENLPFFDKYPQQWDSETIISLSLQWKEVAGGQSVYVKRTLRAVKTRNAILFSLLRENYT